MTIEKFSDNMLSLNLKFVSHLGEGMVKTLDKFIIGESGKVIAVSGERKVKRRLYDMGITNGAEIYLRKKAPLGDPIEVTVRSYELSLRKAEAACITLEVNPNV